MFIEISILRLVVTGMKLFTEIEEKVQVSQGINLYLWIPIILVATLAIIGILFNKKMFSSIEEVKEIKSDDFYKTIAAAGYLYDEKQDIFYSSMEPWQRNMGYCSFYDEAAILSGMIIDCEPVKFIYEGREWLIEFWKGQYGMSTGCEIGAYIKEENEMGVFKEAFYNCVKDEDRLQMSFSLRKNGKTLFSRNEKHWWLTGFKLGEFSQTTDLIMDVSVTLKDFIMRDEFIIALKSVGYLKAEIFINGKTVSFRFNKPRTRQPSTRIEELNRISQRKNEILCDKYQDITRGYATFSEKMKAIKNNAPEIYKKIINIGKSKEVFNIFEKAKNNIK